MSFSMSDKALRARLSVAAYLVIGPRDTKGRRVGEIVKAAVRAGFTAVQLRAKEESAREQIALLGEAARAIEAAGASSRVPLLVDDRLDVALAAREMGVAVAGVHVGQKDVSAHICRRFLGEAAIVGLSAHPKDLPRLAPEDLAAVDYIGTGPLHATASKPDAGVEADGSFRTRSLAEIAAFVQKSPVPVIVGGGVKAADLPAIKAAGAAGFFVISVVAAAADAEGAAREMVARWRE
ncbi:MAG: thiamine phosphate synthase, partial [Selenomonas sp.]